jgi:uncharacterized tellurite resistance protein B-like protein
MKLIEYLTHALQGAPEAPGGELNDSTVLLAAAVLLVELSRGHPAARSGETVRIVAGLRRNFLVDEDTARTLLEHAQSEADHANDLFSYSHLLRSRLSEVQKEALLHSLWHVALADQAIDHYEEQYIAKISGLLAVPNVRHLAIKHRALS